MNIEHRTLKASGPTLCAGAERWALRGVSYGPFAPNARGEPFPDDEALGRDIAQIARLGFNAIRLYDLPSAALLAAAKAQGLRLIVGIPWTDHEDFLCAPSRWQAVMATVREGARRLREEPCVAMILVGNEIEKTLVRWMGPERVQRALEQLIDIAREEAPRVLVSYATYPSTEYLMPRNADVLAVNVYLESQASFARYAQRLMVLAAGKPVIITEFGLDVAAHGEAAQAQARQWFDATVRDLGIGGSVWFSFTDEWHRGGQDVTQWRFGLVDAARNERMAAHELPAPRAAGLPFISVIICTHNGSATLERCLLSVSELRYAGHEVIVVDDGSTDPAVAQITARFPQVRYERQSHQGLSVARNRGAEIARGEIVAYTDDDCLPDAGWLALIAPAFDDPQCVAAGGPNLPPPPRNATEAIVARAPGGPNHVLLDDQHAEHLPGCNLVIRKAALQAIGGFHAPFRVAGDDVDICWRLREAGGTLRFVPGAFVWHHRRFTMLAYFKQQAGYGYAEALLMREHPQRFGRSGGARWQGMIYDADAVPTSLRIFHGPRGDGLFQGIYASGAATRTGARLWFALTVIASALFLYHQQFFAAVVLLYSCEWRDMKLRFLRFWQPIVRGAARLYGRSKLGARPLGQTTIQPVRETLGQETTLDEIAYWSDTGVGRDALLAQVTRVLQEQAVPHQDDDGWQRYDLILWPQEKVRLHLLSVTEYHGGARQLTRVALRSYGSRWLASVRPKQRMALKCLDEAAAAVGLTSVASRDGNLPSATTEPARFSHQPRRDGKGMGTKE